VTDRDPLAVDLGLQGGGAHGAFTWGVLDRLLEEPWLRFDGISGTSAGAMNAVVMASGLAAGGPDGALDLGYSSKLIAEWAFFCMLRDEGRRAAAAFLDAHAADLGVRSTLDLDALLDGI
jgi:hypothetical protein